MVFSFLEGLEMKRYCHQKEDIFLWNCKHIVDIRLVGIIYPVQDYDSYQRMNKEEVYCSKC
jgi:hypothetical protein